MSLREAIAHADREDAAQLAGAQELATIIATLLQDHPRIELAAVLRDHPDTVAVELTGGRQFFVPIEGA